MKKQFKGEARRWMMQAEQDLDDAKYNAAGNRHNVACFLSQQAAEKALKAFLYFNGYDPWGHSVAELVNECIKINQDIADIRKEAALLDKYYIPTRYPNGLPGGIPSMAFDEGDSSRALQIAEKVLQFIRRLIGTHE
ncbi:MAG: HEPN domain-containing protein [Peptococcaceae bacterium]|nr:HEPN domain-containing protein [Peptococcaceae bacterium]